MSIYKETSGSKANRILGEVGGVPNSRRIRPLVGSKYKVGAASDHKWSTGSFTSPFGRGLSKSIRAPKKRAAKSRSRKGR